MSEEEVPASDMPDTQPGEEVPASDMPSQGEEEVPVSDMPDQKDRSTLGQKAMTFVEGMGRPLGGDVLAKYAHDLTGNDAIAPSQEDIQARQTENPGTAAAGEFVGNIAALKGVGSVLPEFERLGVVGSKALKGALSWAAIQGGEEASKYLTGTTPPDESASDALAHMAYSGIVGGATDGLWGISEAAAGKGLKALENKDLVNKTKSFISGYGASVEGIEKPIYDPFLKEYTSSGGEGLDKASWNAGHTAHMNMEANVTKKAIDTATRGLLYAKEGLIGLPASKIIEPYLEKVFKKPVSFAMRKTVVPVINKVMTSGAVEALPQALDYAMSSAKGAQKVSHGMNMLFNSGAHSAYSAVIDPKKRQQIEDAIDENVLDEQMSNQKVEDNQLQSSYAEGGEVKPQKRDYFAELMPQENTIMQSAKSRVYNYLKSLKPTPQLGLAFDKKTPTAKQERTYSNALDLATNPLSILSHAKNGTITGEHVSHMTQMWPELSNHLSKKIQEHITKQQLSGEKPPYKTRQGLAMLLGQPLESAMSQPSIAAAQGTFMPKAPNTPAQGQGKLQRGTSKLGSKTNSMYKTQAEAAETDRISRD
jgi:hypothetical protein